ncbi:mycofactocin system transcriptional regulator [soil metagenome]
MSDSDSAVLAPARAGRQKATTRAELGHIALTLFVQNGFDNTTIDEIATAAGIGRRTFFRYFASKNDLPWGDFRALLEGMREFLGTASPDLSLAEVLRIAVVEFNRFPEQEITYHRQRMTLLLTVPTLVAHSTLRYEAWRNVIAEYAAGRIGVSRDSIEPRSIAWATLGASLSAYEEWLKHDDADLAELLESAFEAISTAFSP